MGRPSGVRADAYGVGRSASHRLESSMASQLGERLLRADMSPWGFVLRLVLLPFSLLYQLGVNVRNALYDTGLIKTETVGVPVVSVGNLTVGGTGKTPLVIHLARAAAAQGRKVAVVTRGYGAVADDEGRGDEAALIASRCPEVDVVVSPNKVLGTRQALERGADLVILDDGMQHRRLHRDLEICVVDGRAPYGNGDLLPTGTLRESPSGLGRADVVVVTHHDTLEPDDLQVLEQHLRAARFDLPIIYATHRPRAVRPVGGGEEQSPQVLAGMDVFLFCGIASPEGFRQTVESLGAEVAGVMGFGDHHAFTGADLAEVRSVARTSRLLCTEKDAAKVARIPGNQDVLCLTVDMELLGELPPFPVRADPAPADHDHH